MERVQPDLPRVEVHGADVRAAADGPCVVELENYSLRFDAMKALSNVDLVIRRGEFVSIVGPSGCGKTTILNLVAGLLDDSLGEGRLRVNGAAPRAGQRDLAYMLSRDALCPWRTVLANAELGAEIRGVPPAQRRELARSLLAQVGLSGFENAYPKALSQGMRQRTALARTFALDAPVLLMDEPFGALDSQTKLQLEEVLLSLWERSRKTVLYITHDLSEAIAMSDRVVVMSARPGRIVATVDIPLPRPRDVRQLQRDPAYLDLYARIWGSMEEGMK